MSKSAREYELKMANYGNHRILNRAMYEDDYFSELCEDVKCYRKKILQSKEYTQEK